MKIINICYVGSYMDNKIIRNVVVFIVVVILSGWIGVLVDSVLTEQPKGDSPGMGICSAFHHGAQIPISESSHEQSSLFPEHHAQSYGLIGYLL